MATLYWATCIHCDWIGNSYEDAHAAQAEQWPHVHENPGHQTTVTNSDAEAEHAAADKERYGV
jgi:hypothetical protein